MMIGLQECYTSSIFEVLLVVDLLTEWVLKVGDSEGVIADEVCPFVCRNFSNGIPETYVL